jgi:putative DNA primase/helicase
MDDMERRLHSALNSPAPPEREPAPAADSWRPIIPAPDDVKNLDVVWKISDTWKGPDETWPYRDADGRLLGYACRWNLPDGHKQIAFATWCRNGSGQTKWKLKNLPAPRPLYGLYELAKRPEAPIVVVEGEKTADAARAVFPESVVVTSSGGSSAVAKSDFSPLANRRSVMIIPDADEPGSNYGTAVATKLADLGVQEIVVAETVNLSARTPDGELRQAMTGWDVADAIIEGWQPDLLRRELIATAKPFDPGPYYVSFHPYTMTANGLTVENMARGEEIPAEEWICSAFEMIGRARDSNGEGWARWIKWRDEDGRVHAAAIADADLHGDVKPLCAHLASRGLRIERNGGKCLADYLNSANVTPRVTVVDRTGWADIGGSKVFVLPDENFGTAGQERIIHSGVGASPYERNDVLEEWTSGVGKLVAGHARPVLAVSMAFAGPLLQLAGIDGGGVNLFGQSSRGKSTCAQAAASVWGKGSSPGFARSWRATANALEAAASISTDTLLILDELGVVESRDAAIGVYQLAAGTGKGRSARDGSLRKSMTWRVMVLSTGEVPMSVKIEEDRNRKAHAGQQVRLLDIPADARSRFRRV